jgi:tetratricopeptide (TPR) repeat protein
MTRRHLAALAVAIGVSVTIGGAYPGTDGPLVDLERRLEANADDLAAANAYRLAIIQTGEYDRAIGFFGRLVQAHPQAANAFLNFGYAYVDKIPAAGSITQVILANSALTHFSRALELRPSWIGFYTRGFSYLFWPKIFGRVPLGVRDLEKALEMQRADTRRPYYVRTYVALGDGYWKADDLNRARAVWRQGLEEFPGNTALERRVHADPAALAAIVQEALDPAKRVNTDLRELWSQP